MTEPTVYDDFIERREALRQMARDGQRMAAHQDKIAEPPRIEDIAPGTTLTAQTLGGVRRLRLTMRDGRLYQRDGGYFAAEDIDPSTIRDVTPPEDAA